MAKKKLSFYDDLKALERYLNFPAGSLQSIPFYARVPAVDAILKVKELQDETLFRPGLYYIVLADLCANTAFNSKYGDAEGDLRTQWFHTAAIEALGEIEITNYVAFNKTIGDAALFVFSSFRDVYQWSERFSANLDALSSEYQIRLSEEYSHLDEDAFEQMLEDFRLRARRFVHLGEVSFKGGADPLSLAVSQTFKVEKNFSKTELGCTQPVANVIRPKLLDLGLTLQPNCAVAIPGIEGKVMTYYVTKARKAAKKLRKRRRKM